MTGALSSFFSSSRKISSDRWEERHIPKGPARGKAARAFGAHSRGPSLAARTLDPNFETALTLQLHVHIPGLTCSLRDLSGIKGGGLQKNELQELNGTNTGNDKNSGGGSKENESSGLGIVLPPCPRDFPTLPFTHPSSNRSTESLLGAIRGKAAAFAASPQSAPFFNWPEAILAFLFDVQRLNLAEIRNPTGHLLSKVDYEDGTFFGRWRVSTPSPAPNPEAVMGVSKVKDSAYDSDEEANRQEGEVGGSFPSSRVRRDEEFALNQPSDTSSVNRDESWISVEEEAGGREVFSGPADKVNPDEL